MFKAILKTVKQKKTKSSLSEQQDINQIPKCDQDNIQDEQKIALKFNRTINDYLLYKVKGAIESIFYLKSILTKDQQEYLMNEIYQKHKRWVDLPHSQRRVQKYGGDVKESGLTNQEDFPEFLHQLSNYCFLDTPKLGINHALINEYPQGVGIYPHFDGPLYHHFVNIFSLNSTCVFKFQKQEQCIKLFVEPGSLLIFTEDAYTEWLHGIEYFHDDTILLQIKDNKVMNTDISNFQTTLLFEQLQSLENQYEFLSSSHNFELCEVKDNDNYNYALIIKRYLRISITLRRVPLP